MLDLVKNASSKPCVTSYHLQFFTLVRYSIRQVLLTYLCIILVLCIHPFLMSHCSVVPCEGNHLRPAHCLLSFALPPQRSPSMFEFVHFSFDFVKNYLWLPARAPSLFSRAPGLWLRVIPFQRDTKIQLIASFNFRVVAKQIQTGEFCVSTFLHKYWLATLIHGPIYLFSRVLSSHVDDVYEFLACYVP